jgi:hypothetical protein
MDGGFFSLEAMTGGPLLQTVSPATTTAPRFKESLKNLPALA